MGLFRKLSNFIVALLLVFNQSGFEFNIHYCGGEVSSISFLHQATSCGMHQIISDKLHKSNSYSSKSCCDDNQLNASSIDIQIESVFNIFKQELVTSSLVDLSLKKSVSTFFNKFLIKDPPQLNKNKRYLLFVKLIDYV